MKSLVLLLLCSASACAYDPLSVADAVAPAALDFTVHDAKRQRDLPVRVYLPTEQKPAPVVLFSHGLGGSRENNPYLGRHWSARGYAVVVVQHPGSDEAVWKSSDPQDRQTAMKQAASVQNFLLRVADIPAVLDQLELWNAASGHALNQRLDMQRVGMSGHSFGAATTQAVSGQSLRAGGARFTDARIKAAVILSPSVPNAGTAEQAFSAVKLPWLLMTGTKDGAHFRNLAVGGSDLNTRLGVYPALPPGDKYELVLKDAEHSAFVDRSLPGESVERNPNHHRAILALTTAFWDAFLNGDVEAKTWLNGDAARTVLEKEDRWQRK
jgi:predicted dienelactone hydrolase